MRERNNLRRKQEEKKTFQQLTKAFTKNTKQHELGKIKIPKAEQKNKDTKHKKNFITVMKKEAETFSF